MCIASNPKHDYERKLPSMVYNFLIKNQLVVVLKPYHMLNQQLADEGNKPIIRKFKICKVHSSFKDNIWGADLGYMQLISKYNKSFRFLLYIIDLVVSFSKYTWVVI